MAGHKPSGHLRLNPRFELESQRSAFLWLFHHAWEVEGGLQRTRPQAGTRARSGGAPNNAPSLRSIAGLLVAR